MSYDANAMLSGIRNYVTAKDATQYDNVDEAMVVVDLTHSNLRQRHIEIRFYKHDKLDTLRQRIHQKSGTPASFQHLQVMVAHGARVVCETGDTSNNNNNNNDASINQILLEIPPETSGSYPLGYFGIEFHGMRIHCIDINPSSGSAGGAYEDTSLVEKYTMTESEYEARQNTLRAWGKEQKERDANFSFRKHAQLHREMVEAQRQHKLGLPLPPGFFIDSAGQIVREEPDVDDSKVEAAKAEKDTIDAEYGPDSVSHVTLQSRCQIEPGSRRGVVAFVGTVKDLPGHWVGVVLDEPIGSNDGSINGVNYFDTPGPKYGALVRGLNIQCGDYPEECDFLSDDDDDDDGDDEI